MFTARVITILREVGTRGTRRLANGPDAVTPDANIPMTSSRDARQFFAKADPAAQPGDPSKGVPLIFQVADTTLKTLLTETFKFAMEQSSTDMKWIYRAIVSLAAVGVLGGGALVWEMERMEGRLQREMTQRFDAQKETMAQQFVAQKELFTQRLDNQDKAIARLEQGQERILEALKPQTPGRH